MLKYILGKCEVCNYRYKSIFTNIYDRPMHFRDICTECRNKDGATSLHFITSAVNRETAEKCDFDDGKKLTIKSIAQNAYGYKSITPGR